MKEVFRGKAVSQQEKQEEVVSQGGGKMLEIDCAL
jgi:hypothetical protein